MKNWRGKARLMLLFLAIAALVFFSRPGMPALLWGSILVALGESIRLWAAGHLHKTSLLITSGPYRYTRNPMYLGRLLIFTGLALAAWLPHLLSLPLLVVGYLLFFLYYLPRKERIEGARLAQQHGEPYEAYRAGVPALFPSLRPWGESEARWRLDRFQRNREVLTAVGLAAILVYLAARVAI